MRYRLNSVEQALAKFIASQWDGYDKEKGFHKENISKKNSFENSTAAFGAELAFCRMMNVYPGLDLGVWRYWDCVLHNKLKVNVKQTDKENFGLVVQLKLYSHYPDVYACMQGEFPVFEYKGWCWDWEMRIQSRINRSLPVAAYFMTFNQLRKGRIEHEKGSGTP